MSTKTLEDHMHSFFLAETCKYLHLLFDPSFMRGRNVVFSTEGHPFPVLAWRAATSTATDVRENSVPAAKTSTQDDAGGSTTDMTDIISETNDIMAEATDAIETGLEKTNAIETGLEKIKKLLGKIAALEKVEAALDTARQQLAEDARLRRGQLVEEVLPEP